MAEAPLPFAWGVLYAKPNLDGSADERCSIHPKSLKVPAQAICGYHVFGVPMETRVEHPGMDPVDPALSGFAEDVGEGTYCGSCIYYEPTSEKEGNCWAVASKDRHPPQEVAFMGCCARWEGIPEEER